MTRKFSLSRFSGSQTPQKIGELKFANVPGAPGRDVSKMFVPLMRSVNVEPESSNVNFRREYWPSTKKLPERTPL